jgi:RNA recognition motif-containing protein
MNPTLIEENKNLEKKSVLYFADLDPTTNDFDIKNFIGSYQNSIAHLELKYNKNSPFLSAIVIFKDSSQAIEVKNNFNMKKLKNRAVRIMWHDKEGIRNISRAENSNIFVKNIPLQVTPRELFEKFVEFGEIASIKLSENFDGSHKGYGYISYEDSKSAVLAINGCHDKAVFTKYPDHYLDVEFFKKQNERINYNIINNNNTVKHDISNKINETNSSLFVKNFPEKANEEEIKKLFDKYGKIIYFKPNFYINNKETVKILKSCILSYDNEVSAAEAEKVLNNSIYLDGKLVVEKLSYSEFKSKPSYLQEKKQPLPTNRNSVLYVKNIPDKVNEEFLRKVFSEFGTLTNVKIFTNNIMQKIDGQFKEIEISLGSGQIHYETADEALVAKEKMNNKYLPGYETWKYPLYVDIYMTSKERKGDNFITNSYFGSNTMMGYPPTQFYGQGYYGNQQSKYNPIVVNNTPNNQINQITNKMNEFSLNQNDVKKVKDDGKNFKKIDINHFNSLPDISQKREYMGEVIFNNINDHPLVTQANISIDEVGKITGMILGIEDLNEILLPCSNYSELTSRIEEALNLIREAN